MVTLRVQCPWCEYRDAGYDTDMIMIEYRRHEKQCEYRPDTGSIFMPKNKEKGNT